MGLFGNYCEPNTVCDMYENILFALQMCVTPVTNLSNYSDDNYDDAYNKCFFKYEHFSCCPAGGATGL